MSEFDRYSLPAVLAEKRRTAEPHDAVAYIGRARKLAAENPPKPPGARPPSLTPEAHARLTRPQADEHDRQHREWLKRHTAYRASQRR